MEDLIAQNGGHEPENTIGYDDDVDELEAELLAQEAGCKEKLRAANGPGGNSGFAVGGVGDVTESQEIFFVAPEGEQDAGRAGENTEGDAGVSAEEK